MIGVVSDNVTWHLPYKATGNSPSSSGKYAFQTRSLDAVLDGTSEVAAATENEEAAAVLKIIGTLAQVTDWTYPYKDEPHATGNRNDGTSWKTAVSLTQSASSGPAWPENAPVDLLDNPNGWTECSMSLCRVAYYTWNYWSADAYCPQGYVSSGHTLGAYQITSDQDQPFFVPLTY